jgi:hypothetical protein
VKILSNPERDADCETGEATAEQLHLEVEGARTDLIQEAVETGDRRALLFAARSVLARDVAFLEWIALNPEVFSLSRQLDLCRAIGRKHRAIRCLLEICRAHDEDRGAEGDPPPELVERVMAMFKADVLRVLRDVTSAETASRFEEALELRLKE